MDSVFGPVDGVTGIADDTFTYGKSKRDHDNHLINVLETARKNNVKFNPDKFQCKVPEASFFEMKWTAEGLRVDENKVQSIVNMEPPKDVKELQSFLGMIKYLNRFSPILAHTSQPIHNLAKKDVPFQWQSEQQLAFQQIKEVISKAPVLAYYDPEKENIFQSDASMHGLGCLLLQDGKPVCYASRFLTEQGSYGLESQ